MFGIYFLAVSLFVVLYGYPGFFAQPLDECEVVWCRQIAIRQVDDVMVSGAGQVGVGSAGREYTIHQRFCFDHMSNPPFEALHFITIVLAWLLWALLLSFCATPIAALFVRLLLRYSSFEQRIRQWKDPELELSSLILMLIILGKLTFDLYFGMSFHKITPFLGMLLISVTFAALVSRLGVFQSLKVLRRWNG